MALATSTPQRSEDQQLIDFVERIGAQKIDINPEPNPYSEHACDRVAQGKGLWLRGSATRWVPELVEQLIALRS